MPRLIRVFAGRTCHFVCFVRGGSFVFVGILYRENGHITFFFESFWVFQAYANSERKSGQGIRCPYIEDLTGVVISNEIYETSLFGSFHNVHMK